MTPNRIWFMLIGMNFGFAQAQWSLMGDLYIAGNTEMHIAFSKTHFITGKITTARAPKEGIVSFAENSQWQVYSPNSYVDGIVRTYHSGSFNFPVGNATLFSPIAVEDLTTTGYFQMQYTQELNAPLSLTHSSFRVLSNHVWTWATEYATGNALFKVSWGLQHQLNEAALLGALDQLQLGTLVNGSWQPVESFLAPDPLGEGASTNSGEVQVQTLFPIDLSRQNALTLLRKQRSSTDRFSPKLPLISQVVTPNGDGLNDQWKIENLPFHHNTSIELFDVFGQLIYKNRGAYEIPWAGYHYKSGKKVPQGAYLYSISTGIQKRTGWLYLKWE